MTPAQLCRSTKESGSQRALFAWANMAMTYGFIAADQDKSYTVEGHAAKLLALYNDAEPRLKWLHHIKNEEKGGLIRGANAKAEGVKPGVADVCLPVRITGFAPLGMIIPVYWCGLYIELKRETGGKPTKEQVEFGEFVKSQGYMWRPVVGWYLASRVVMEYLRS